MTAGQLLLDFVGPQHDHRHPLDGAVGLLLAGDAQMLEHPAVLALLGVDDLGIERHLRPVEQFEKRGLDLGRRRVLDVLGGGQAGKQEENEQRIQVAHDDLRGERAIRPIRVQGSSYDCMVAGGLSAGQTLFSQASSPWIEFVATDPQRRVVMPNGSSNRDRGQEVKHRFLRRAERMASSCRKNSGGGKAATREAVAFSARTTTRSTSCVERGSP